MTIPVSELKSIRLFSGLGDNDLSRLALCLQKCVFLSGMVILSRSEAADALYFIIEGRVRVELMDSKGQILNIAEFGPGEYFGERAILTGEPRTADVRAVSAEVVTVKLLRADFESLLCETPLLYANLCRDLALRLGSWAQRHQREESEHREVMTNLSGWQLLPEFGAFPGGSPWVRSLNRRLETLGSSRENVLILGEPGTWKDLAARLIHFHGDSASPVLFLDCATPPPLPGQVEEPRQSMHEDTGLLGTGQYAALFGRLPGSDCRSGPMRKGMLDLASGGDLILRNIDCLTPDVQESLLSFIGQRGGKDGDRPEFAVAGVRIIATSGEPLSNQAESGAFNKALFEKLSGETLVMSPLRERKRDIPVIARSLLRTLNAKYHKSITKLSQDALNRLVDHDWPLNGTELYQVLSRAVLVCAGDRLLSEHIFLQGRQFATGRLNLLTLPAVEKLARRPGFPRLLRWSTVPLFLLVLSGTLLGGESDNAANLAVWTLWWPALLLTGFLFARGWCSYCPLEALGELAGTRDGVHHEPSSLLQRYGAAISLSLFVVIFLAEQATGMFSYPFATGLLLLILLVSTVSGDLLLGRRGWCKYLCPLGRIVSLASRISFLEMHSNHNVCASRCKVDECVKEKGCPMGLHPSGIDNSDHCVLCLDCVRNCSHHSMELDLRTPASGLSIHGRSGFAEAMFSITVVGLIVAVKVTPCLFPGRPNPHLWGMGEFFYAMAITGSFTACAMIFSTGVRRQRWKASFSICGTAYIPIALTGLFIFYFREFVSRGEYLVPWSIAGFHLDGLLDAKRLTPDLGTLRLLVSPLLMAGGFFSLSSLSSLAKEYNLGRISLIGHRLLLVAATLSLVFLL